MTVLVPVTYTSHCLYKKTEGSYWCEEVKVNGYSLVRVARDSHLGRECEEAGLPVGQSETFATELEQANRPGNRLQFPMVLANRDHD